MTQVELPQMSLQRYLELVKRRRWQLVPVSLLGLVVGGLIAFFIPRYFVASTLIQHEAVPGEALDRGDDPFKSIVASARNTIPQAVGKALEALKWPEALVSDPHEKALYEREVQSRLRVEPVNSDGNREQFAELQLTYLDRDGARAATFVNTLFQVWSEKRVAQMRDNAEKLRRVAQEDERRWAGVRETCLQEQRRIEERYRINPGADAMTTRDLFQRRERERSERRDKLRDKQAEVTLAKTRLDVDRELLGTMPPRVPPDPLTLEKAAAENPELLTWLVFAKTYRRQMETFQPGTSHWAGAKRGYERAQREIKKLLNPESPDGDGNVPNPEREALQKQILAAEEALRVLEQELADLREETDAEDRRLGEAHDGYWEWDKNNTTLANATKHRDDASEVERAQANIVTKLLTRRPMTQVREATTPPRPTEPNILVVALIGCVLGLGAAIALILVLDLLQGSFKTVDDVERGLTVPVLGGMSHLETDEERRTTQRSRRRASLAAFSFVALVVVVVTIFYVDPTRLPRLVRDLLAMLLGS